MYRIWQIACYDDIAQEDSIISFKKLLMFMYKIIVFYEIFYL